MTLLLIMGATLVFVAIALVASALGDAEPHGMNRSLAVLQAMTSAPKELTKDLDIPAEVLASLPSEEEIRALDDPDFEGIALLPIRPRVKTAPVIERP